MLPEGVSSRHKRCYQHHPEAPYPKVAVIFGLLGAISRGACFCLDMDNTRDPARANLSRRTVWAPQTYFLIFSSRYHRRIDEGPPTWGTETQYVGPSRSMGTTLLEVIAAWNRPRRPTPAPQGRPELGQYATWGAYAFSPTQTLSISGAPSVEVVAAPADF